MAKKKAKKEVFKYPTITINDKEVKDKYYPVKCQLGPGYRDHIEFFITEINGEKCLAVHSGTVWLASVLRAANCIYLKPKQIDEF